MQVSKKAGWMVPLLAATLAAGCDGDGGVNTTDASPDMRQGEIDALVTDMMPLPDMTGTPDMAVTPDMAPDMQVTPDMAVEPDMAPDMAGPMCGDATECDDTDVCTEDACTDGMCSNTPIEGCCTDNAGCGDAGRCLEALNQCADAAAPGAVVITELLVDAEGVSDADGEWFEVVNTTDAPILLNGWRIEGGENEAFDFNPAEPAVLEAGARAVFGRNADMAANGGVAVDYVYDGFALANGGDRIALVDALGTVIDEVVYDDTWPIEPGAALSLAPGSTDAMANDDPANWCPAPMAWADGDRGSPGAENPECVVDGPLVDWCRLQAPLDAEVAAGAEIVVYARVFEAGVTDLSDAVDVDANLVVQAGFGGDGTDPAAAEWTWVAAEPNLGWNAAAAGEPGNDEYQATFNAPEPGVYDHAVRASIDSGETWIYCDRDAGDGSDGAEDGYQIANAGALTVLPAGCADLVCNTPPAAACDGNAVVAYAPEGRCIEGPDGVECAYDALDPVDCGDQLCERGACIAPAPAPDAPGQLVITEILYDPHGPLAEGDAEWFEVHNPTDSALRLDGCRLADSNNVEVIEGLTIEAGAYAVFGHTADQALNGGITPDALFEFGLNNGGDTISITCGPADAEIVIDSVTYDDGPDFPDARRASIALDPDALDANEIGANWCLAVDVYYQPADQPEEEWHRGTPGAPNPACPEPDVTIDWCRLQFPLEPSVGAGTPLTVYGRVFEAGITDRSPGTDIDQGVMAQLGLGPVGSQPDDTWNWTPADPNLDWNDAAEPGNDEYQAEIVVPAPGLYAFAYRFSRDMGATWLYCDRDAGDGSDGAEDGYQPVNAGLLTSQAGPCDDVICDAPPAPRCDGDVRVESLDGGACNAVDGVGVCTYEEVRTDCTLDGGRCDAGACVDAAQPPAADELVITEILYDPQGVLAENTAEWFEVLNRSDRVVNLNGCELFDSNNTQAIDQPLLIEPGAYALFGKSQDQAVNGGLDIAFTFGFGLNNGGDTVGIRCGDATIDSVDYSQAGFPDPSAASIRLSDPALDNANGANWCVGEAVYFEDADNPHLGTPGAVNPPCAPADPCDPNPCNAPPAPSCQDENTVLAASPEGACAVGDDGAPVCDYNPQPVPCAEGEACVEGACVEANGPRAPAAGEVVITEIMYDPHHGLDDGAAEWFELHNPTEEALDLDACRVDDGRGTLALTGLTIEPGAYLVFARNADAALNGGLEPAAVFEFSLGNGGDSLTVICAGDVQIDTVTYDDGPDFPDARAHSISLDPGALDANEDGANWCLARSVYFADADPALSNHGTPGAPNDPCDVPVDFGALQFPLSVEAQTDTEVIVYGRVYQEGITDRSTAVDASPLLRAQLGFGPDGSDPQANDAWTWINGAPNPEWDGAAADQPNNDEYQATLRLPAPGEYDYAWRFSADGGRTWTYADAEPAGSSDGYQIESAGQLTSLPQLDPCDPNPCNMPPAPSCQDENTVLEASPEGICAVGDNGAPVCDYNPQPVPCADGQICAEGACVDAGLRAPAPGEVVITEIMYDPHYALQDGAAEWFELHNRTEAPLDLDACRVDDNRGTLALTGLTIEAGGYLVFAKSADAALNGGLDPAAVFEFSLGNGGDSLTVVCADEVQIDTVAYDDGPDFPDARARSISLDPGALDANEDGANWCLARDVYFADADPALNNYGTPGAPNPACDVLAEFGRLQFPLEANGPMTTVYGRVYHPGITDRSPATDASPLLVAELGYGPDGSDPAGDGWTWIRGVPNAEYDGNASGEPNNDEYQADLVIPEGVFDYAWRFSADGGRTWRYADGQPAGSSDGYQPENAGQAVNQPF